MKEMIVVASVLGAVLVVAFLASGKLNDYLDSPIHSASVNYPTTFKVSPSAAQKAPAAQRELSEADLKAKAECAGKGPNAFFSSEWGPTPCDMLSYTEQGHAAKAKREAGALHPGRVLRCRRFAEKCAGGDPAACTDMNRLCSTLM